MLEEILHPWVLLAPCALAHIDDGRYIKMADGYISSQDFFSPITPFHGAMGRFPRDVGVHDNSESEPTCKTLWPSVELAHRVWRIPHWISQNRNDGQFSSMGVICCTPYGVFQPSWRNLYFSNRPFGVRMTKGKQKWNSGSIAVERKAYVSLQGI